MEDLLADHTKVDSICLPPWNVQVDHQGIAVDFALFVRFSPGPYVHLAPWPESRKCNVAASKFATEESNEAERCNKSANGVTLRLGRTRAAGFE